MAEIVQFAELKISRKHREYLGKDCKHLRLVICDHGGTVECEDCKKQIDPIWALQFLAYEWADKLAALNRKQQEMERVIAGNIHTKAALKVQDAWRSRSMVPCCPHCGRGIFPSDGVWRHNNQRRYGKAAQSGGRCL